MATVFVNDEYLSDIADAIRSKNGSSNTYTPAEMASAIEDIGGGDYVAEDWLDISKPVGSIVSDILLTASSSTGLYRLAYRTGITSLHLTESTTTTHYMCQGCSNLETFVMRKGGPLVTNALSYCSKLTGIDVLSSGNMSSDCIRDDKKLKTIVIRGDTIKVFGTNAFRGWTPPSGCTFYISKILHDHLGDGTADDYKAATNWSSWSYINTVNWEPIEGSIYETQYVDGTPIPTT